MRRRDLIACAGIALFARPPAVRALVPDRVPLIAVLMAIADGPEGQSRISAFREGLQRLGWTDGRNVRFEVRWAGGDPQRMRAGSTELDRLAPDVILVNGTQAASILLRDIRNTPVVFVQVSDPLGRGLVTSLARPGGNATGFSSNEAAVLGKCVEVLKDIAPRVTKAAFLFNPDDPAWEAYWRAGESVAASLHVGLMQAAIHEGTDIESKINAFAREGDVGLLVQPTSLIAVHRELIVALAAKLRLPAVYPQRAFVASGGLASYGIATNDEYRRAAIYVARILKGERPGEMPVQPTKFELVINVKTAEALGLEVPMQLRHLADEVLE